MRHAGIGRVVALLLSPQRLGFALLLTAAAASALHAQATGTIRGTVSKEGQPLVGAQVNLTGTALGARTGEDGRYTIVNVPEGAYRIRAQMLGHRPLDHAVTVTAGGTVERDFAMRTEAIGLDAVVVTGTAGQARQREVGNAISQIDLSKIQQPVQSVGALLQGRSTGMTVMQSSAAAGSGSMIRLRGNVSVAMSNQPLIYIDGVRMRSEGYARNFPASGTDLRSSNDVSSPMNDINPSDIERIEIIKGAAAATLYGTEAAAGVIQIFTKSGHAGRPVWTFETNQGFAKSLKFGPDPERAPPSDTIYGCVVVSPCSGTAEAYRDSFPDRFAGLPRVGVSRAGGTSSFLFIDPWLRNGYRDSYAVSVAGGGEPLRYFVSASVRDEDSVLPNDNENKKIVRGNFSLTPLSNLLLSWNTSYTKDNISNTAAGNNAHGLTLNAFRRDRNYASNDRPEVMAGILNQFITSEIDHLVTGATATWNPITNLMNAFTVGYDLAAVNNRNLRPFGYIQAPSGILSDRRHAYQNLTFEYKGNFQHVLRQDLRGTLSWGGQSVTTDTRETSAYGENFPGPGEPTVSSAGTKLGFEERQRVVNAGFFTQGMLDVKNRYFFTVGARIDGNSAFGEDFGLQTYPKVSASWVMSDESFWPAWSPAMKLRMAWGQSGRAPGAFDAVRTWDPVGWGGSPAFFPNNVGNPDLGPERTSETEIGFDAAFFDDRITTEFTYYDRKIDDALFFVSQTPSEGFLNSQLRNVGRMKSNGLEFAANASVWRGRNFEWTVGGSMFTNDTKVLSLGGAPNFQIADFGWIIEGQSIPMIHTDFCVQNPNGPVPLNASGQPAPVIITASGSNDCNHGPNLPTLTYGVHTGLDLPRGLSLRARGEYLGGHYMYDGAAYNAVVRSVRWPGCYDFYTLQETGRIAEAKAIDAARCTVSLTRADYFVYPADFFKLRELSLSAPIPTKYLRGAKSGQFVVSGHNLWKWVNDDFPVFDPETGNNGGYNARVRSILEHVPPPAVYTAAVRLTF